MTIVYVVGKGADAIGNTPLRLSLRSIDKFGEGIDRVIVVGNTPDFLSDKVEKIPCEDKTPFKHKNILNCIETAISTAEIKSDFLYSSDDHYILKPVDFSNYPYWANGFLKSEATYFKEGTNCGIYKRSLASTYELLKRNKLSTVRFCLHRNTHMNAEDVEEVMLLSRQEQYINRTYGYEPSCLFNSVRFSKKPFVITQIAEGEDSKIKSISDFKSAVSGGRTFISTSQRAEQGCSIVEYMSNFFNGKSKWEA